MRKLHFVFAAALAAAGCHGGSNGNGENLEVADSDESAPALPEHDYYVDQASGNDANPGTPEAPLKTITRALALAQTGDSVKVAPGTYSLSSGEVFPLVLPAGVELLGDEETKGSTTRLYGGGKNANGYGTVVDPGAGSTLAGFTITNTNTALTFPMELAVRQSQVTIRNNRIVNGKDVGIYVYNGSVNHLITGNVIQNIKNGWSGLGLGFIGGGVGSRVEGNVITGNEVGVEYDSAGGDLGGGPAGSLGQNVLAKNTRADLWTVTGGITIYAKNNLWDHVPPTEATSSSNDTVTAGNDVYNMNSAATIVTTGAQLAP